MERPHHDLYKKMPNNFSLDSKQNSAEGLKQK